VERERQVERQRGRDSREKQSRKDVEGRDLLLEERDKGKESSRDDESQTEIKTFSYIYILQCRTRL
jgi:hypothetical protein